MGFSKNWLLGGLAMALLVLPWLNPLASGPSPGVMPLLMAWACVAGLLGLYSAWAQTAVVPGGKVASMPLAKVVATAWLVAALLSAMMGLLQYSGVAHSLTPWVNSSAVGEAYANLRQRNQFASLTNIGLVALLWWSEQIPTPAENPAKLEKILAVFGMPLLAALLALGNAASASRTGLLQLLMLLFLLWVFGGWRQQNIRRIMLTALLAYAVAAWALPALLGLDGRASGILGRFSDPGEACASRTVLWRNVLALIAQKPWFGWGWGELDYAHFMTLYPGERFCDLLDNAHNLPLHLAVELGVPFSVLFCGVVLWLIWRARPWAERDPDRCLAWGVLAVIALHSMLEYPLWYGPFQIAAGLSVILLWRQQAAVMIWMKTAIQRTGLGLSMLMLALIFYAAWDYHRVSQIYREPNLRSPEYRDNTLEKIRDTRLFRDQFNFAELTITPLTQGNAQAQNVMAKAMLHYSPEASVVEKIIESAIILGQDEEALFYLTRYQAAYPRQQAAWSKAQALAKLR